MKKSFKQFLTEAPLGDFKTFGNWDKNSSFRHKVDRDLIRHPKYHEKLNVKLGKSPYTWNLYFINTPQANKHTEVGNVDIKWVEENLGEELAHEVAKHADDDSINVIFTNNKGSERMPMTIWILFHRFGHAVARKRGMREEWTQYKQASNFLIENISNILELYGKNDFPKNERQLTDSGYSGNRYESARKNQLILMSFFNEIATFKSARDKNLRDWFEVLNELIAQYVTTGHIKFNPAPKCFNGRTKNNGSFNFCTKEQEEANEMVETLARDLEFMLDDILASAVNNIYVM